MEKYENTVILPSVKNIFNNNIQQTRFSIKLNLNAHIKQHCKALSNLFIGNLNPFEYGLL